MALLQNELKTISVFRLILIVFPDINKPLILCQKMNAFIPLTLTDKV